MSDRKDHHYLTVVRDHDTGRVVWAEVSRDSKTLSQFFHLFGAERSSRIEAVSTDAASRMAKVVRAN